MSHAPNTLSLVADIGGTNTRVALAKGTSVLAGTVTKYRNEAHESLEDVLRQFIKEQDNVDTAAACVAIAGPVRNGQASMTNLDWEIDEATLSAATGAERTALLNDLQAQGHALGFLPAASERTLFKGTSPETGTARLMIGLGTGFNIAPVFETSNGRYVAASESGHISLPVLSETDARLADWVNEHYGFPTIEHALSGGGLENLYRFHCRQADEKADLSAAQIMAAHNTESSPEASRAVEQFIRLLGTVCGDFALVQLPFSGIYLVGGVARAMVPHLNDHGFIDAFKAKGRFADFMNTFSIRTIEDDFAALTGCAAYLDSLRAGA